MSHRTNIKSDDTKNNMADNFSKETYALTNEQKERIYSTMIRKLNIEMTDSTKVITGVEKCPRNSIFRITATAVSAAALIAGIGINFTLMHNMNKSISEISVTDDSLTASEAASQSPREEMPLFIGSTAVNECATTAAVPAKTVSISVSESSITTSVQTAALTETTVTEPEASAETTESETAVVGSEAFNETAYRSEDDNNVPYSGSVVDDIDDLCNDDYFTNKSYRIEVRNTPKDQPSIKVNSISLRDDLGNIVAQKTLDNGSNGGYIDLDLKRGDINYDGVINSDDTAMIREYLGNSDVTAFSTLQRELMDINRNGRIDDTDAEIINFIDTGRYVTESGAVYTGWHLICGDSFFLDENGVKITNAFIDDENKNETYFVDADGLCVKDSMFTFEGGLYCADEFGYIIRNREYDTAIAKTGTSRIFFFDESGRAVIGWNADKTKYYSEAGMYTGWHLIDGENIFFDENGVRAD